MKKILLLTAAIFAATIVSRAETGNSVHNIITKQIKIPSELKDSKLNEKVNVQFRLENGKAYVIDVTTSNPELKNCIIEQFKAMKFDNINEKATTYFVDINFKVL
jgi:uncharacterized membrane protein